LIKRKTIERISKIFIGDEVGYYKRKTGYELVKFFNKNFGYNHEYGVSPKNPSTEGFTTRYIYVSDILEELISFNRINAFFNIILDELYIMKELDISEIDALDLIQKLLREFNRILKIDGSELVEFKGEYKLEKIDEDLQKVGEGGFAEVYYQKSTGYVVKKLKRNCLKNHSDKSRFRREYEITKSIADIEGIIKVIDFNENSFSYRMEKADCTIKEFIDSGKGDSIDSKIWIVKELLKIMRLVHERNILHRDLSPTNIFKVGNQLKIGDFGLGKDINIIHSYQTNETLAVGQLFYSSPEQMKGLKNCDKKSDVYSLGKVINYIFTKDSDDTSHILKNISETATHKTPKYRYKDAGEMYDAIKNRIEIDMNKNYRLKIFEEIKQGNITTEVKEFIYGLSGEYICKYLVEGESGFSSAILAAMKNNELKAFNIIRSIEVNYQNYILGINGGYTAWDPFGELCYSVLNEHNPEFSYSVKEVAARILRYVAKDINRFSAQDMIRELKIRGIDPSIEEILD